MKFCTNEYQLNIIVLATFLSLSFIIMLSCKGKEKPTRRTSPIKIEKKEKSTKNTQPVKIENFPSLISSDYDPYFVAVETVNTAKGPSSITRNIIQDSKGNIWLATWEGIIRYDGKNFTNFTNKVGLRQTRVFTLLEDIKGNLWFGTIGAGVYRYDGKKFTNLTIENGLIHNKVTCIYEDKAGLIWFGTVGGISRYDGKTFTNFTTKDGLLDNEVNSIIEDKTGKFWIGTRGAACTFDGKTFTKFTNANTLTNFTNAKSDSFMNVRCIIADHSGDIWLGGNDGLWQYSNNILTNYDSNFVGYIYEDKKGNIWTSSVANNDRHSWALTRYDKKPFPDKKRTYTVIKTEENMFFGIMEDKEEGIWLGSLRGACRFFEGEVDCFGRE